MGRMRLLLLAVGLAVFASCGKDGGREPFAQKAAGADRATYVIDF